MKKTLSKRKIYRIKNKSIDEIINAFHFVDAQRQTVNLPFNYTVTGNLTDEERKENEVYMRLFEQARNKIKRENLLGEKFQFLVHCIIARSVSCNGAWFTLSSTILEEIFGKDYVLMLRTLRSLGLITIDQKGVDGTPKVANVFRVNEEMICSTEEPMGFLKGFFEKRKYVFEKHRQETNKVLIEKLGGDKEFFVRYNKSLSYLKVKNPSGARGLLSTFSFLSDESKDYYEDILNRYDEEKPSISSVDDNGRIYHILTNTPRVLKPFLNLWYGCDAHNSHPHLFNSYLLRVYGVESDEAMSLFNALKEISIQQSIVVKEDFSVLKDLLLREKGIKTLLPDDVLYYVYLTTNGTFWDYSLEVASQLSQDESISRPEIKQKLFAEVFYMNNPLSPKVVRKSGLEYLKVFEQTFPNVYKSIYALKKKRGEGVKKLPCSMMELESLIFHEILSEIYKHFPKSKVISVHDAIYVLDHKDNLNITPEQVEKIMIEVYNKHRLSPTISIEYYGDKK